MNEPWRKPGTFKGTATTDKGLFIELVADAYSDDLDYFGGKVFAYHDGREVGYMPYGSVGQVIQIGDMEVVAHWRRQGVGRAMVEFVRSLGIPLEHYADDADMSPAGRAFKRSVGASDLADALWSLKGSYSDLALHLMDEEAGAPIPSSGSGAKMRRRAAALVRAAGPIPITLYRGSAHPPSSWEAWSEDRRVAERWARRGGVVWELPVGPSKGIRVADHIQSQIDDEEREWVVARALGAVESGLSPSARSESGTSPSRSGSRRSRRMRPTMKAVAEQQVLIEAQGKVLDRIARVAGVDISDIKAEARSRVAAIRRRADLDNPAQPVAEPAPEAPAATTDGTISEIPKDDPESAGAGPVTDVSPDAVTSPLAVGGVAGEDPINLGEMVDVEAPVAGTTDQLPLSETRTESDVDASGGSNQEVAHPTAPGFGPAKVSSNRTFASLRLARLRIQAGIEQGDDLIIGERIANEASMTDREIETEISTLSRVVSASSRGDRPAHLVPRAATAGRSMPSLGAVPSMEELAITAGRVTEDEVLFEG